MNRTLMKKSKNKICLYGLGTLLEQNFERIIHMVGSKPDFVFDRNALFWGKRFKGVLCLNELDFKKNLKNLHVVITLHYFDEIAEQLAHLGCRNITVVHYDKANSTVSRLTPYQNIKDKLNANETATLSRVSEWCYITGSTRGIGLETAKFMAQNGVNLILHGSGQNNSENLKSYFSQYDIETIITECNFESPSDIEQHCKWIENDAPDIKLVYCNAGVSLHKDEASFQQGTIDGWTKTFKVNVFSNAFLLRSLLKKMSVLDNGKIFFTSSAINKKTDELAYSCSKAALNKMVQEITQEPDYYKVEFCLIDPGWVKSDMGGSDGIYHTRDLIPGMVFAAFTSYSCNGSWITAPNYRNMTLQAAINRGLAIGDLH